MHTINNTINLTEYNGFKLHKLADIDASQIMKVTLEKGAKFPAHTSKTDVTLVMLEGIITFFINNQKFDLSKFQVFQFPKDEMHDVVANENSKFLLIK